MSKKKDEEDEKMTSFSIYYKHQDSPQYPFLLALALQKSDSQL